MIGKCGRGVVERVEESGAVVGGRNESGLLGGGRDKRGFRVGVWGVERGWGRADGRRRNEVFDGVRREVFASVGPRACLECADEVSVAVTKDLLQEEARSTGEDLTQNIQRRRGFVRSGLRNGGCGRERRWVSGVGFGVTAALHGRLRACRWEVRFGRGSLCRRYRGRRFDLIGFLVRGVFGAAGCLFAVEFHF